MKIKINWIFEGDSRNGDGGYWRSSEGRFRIRPYGFRHNVTPDGFKVEDSMGEITCQYNSETQDYRGTAIRKSHSFDTVRDCKEWALWRITQEINKAQ